MADQPKGKKAKKAKAQGCCCPDRAEAKPAVTTPAATPTPAAPQQPVQSK